MVESEGYLDNAVLVPHGDPAALMTTDGDALSTKSKPFDPMTAVHTFVHDPVMVDVCNAPLLKPLPLEVAVVGSTGNAPAVVSAVGDTKIVGKTTESDCHYEIHCEKSALYSLTPRETGYRIGVTVMHSSGVGLIATSPPLYDKAEEHTDPGKKVGPKDEH